MAYPDILFLKDASWKNQLSKGVRLKLNFLKKCSPCLHVPLKLIATQDS